MLNNVLRNTRHFRSILALAVLVAAGPLASGCDAAQRPSSPGVEQRSADAGVERAGLVIRVRDGDSLVVRAGGIGIEVRLDGVDSPELVQAYGRRAKRFTADLAFGREVRLLVKGRDAYGRELAEVMLGDGRSLNRELVSAGYAWWFRRHSNDRDLEERERQARAARRGLWADPNPVPPWVFREAQPASARPW